jgi:isopenicillin N synthase-like dioxygenase
VQWQYRDLVPVYPRFHFTINQKNTTMSANSNVVIKTIDLGNFLNGDTEQRRAVAMEIGEACEEIGFLVVTGHGIPDDVIDNAWTSTARFFDTDENEKRKYITANEAEYPFGYSILGGEILSSGKDAESNKISANACPDLKEMFSLGPADPASGFPTRRWPVNPTEFEPAMTAYYDALNSLANSMLQAMAIALGLDEKYFERFVDHHASALRCYYIVIIVTLCVNKAF